MDKPPLPRQGRTPPDRSPGLADQVPSGPFHAALVERHYAAVYRYAYRLAGSPADAEDLTQQTFLIALQKLHQVRAPECTLSWLWAVLRRCYLKSCRKRKPHVAADLQLEMDRVEDYVEPPGPVDAERLQLALNALPDEFKLVVLMFYFEQCSYQEIAEELQVSIGTVMSRLSRAKAHLRRRLLRSVPDSWQTEASSPRESHERSPVITALWIEPPVTR